MKRMLMGLGIAAAIGGLDRGAGEAKAQYPGTSTVYETVAPGYSTINYGERVKFRRGPFKTVIKERPFAYINQTPPVVRETRYVQPAPVMEQVVVQPPPIAQDVVVQPPPIVERRYIQQAPVIQNRVLSADPVIQTRYFSPYP